MMPAQEKLASDLRRTAFAPLRVPLVTNVDAELISSGEEAREALIRQVSLPVRWEESMHARSEEHTSELQSRSDLVCRLLLEKKKKRRLGRCLYCTDVGDRRRSECVISV